MSELVPESVPGRPWLDPREGETFETFVARIARTCTLCGGESDSGKPQPPHECVAPDIEQVVRLLGLDI